MLSDDQQTITLYVVIDDDGTPLGSPWEYMPEAIDYAQAANERERGAKYTVSEWSWTYAGQRLIWAPEWADQPAKPQRGPDPCV